MGVTEAVAVSTDTTALAVAEHPAALLAVTVWVVVAEGVTVTVAPNPPGVLHRYMVPPLAVKVAEEPLHIVSVRGVIAALTDVTVTVVVAVAEHPAALVTVTEYDCVAPGVTVIAAVVAPVFQSYPAPP